MCKNADNVIGDRLFFLPDFPLRMNDGDLGTRLVQRKFSSQELCSNDLFKHMKQPPNTKFELVAGKG